MSIRNDIFEAINDYALTLLTDPQFTGGVKEVTLFERLKLDRDGDRTPVVMLIDDANEHMVAQTDTDAQYETELRVVVYVVTDTERNITAKINAVVDDIKTLVNEAPAISNMLSWILVSVDDVILGEQSTSGIAVIKTKLLWHEARGYSYGSHTVFGTDWETEVRNAIVTQLAEVFTAPLTHSTHYKATIKPLDVSVGLLTESETDGAEAIGTSGIVGVHELDYEIRAHTGFIGGRADEQLQTKILVSIDNKLRANLRLLGANPNVRVQSVGGLRTGQEFKESNTIGGSLIAKVRTVVEHTQE